MYIIVLQHELFSEDTAKLSKLYLDDVLGLVKLILVHLLMFICSKSSNPCDLIVERTGGKSQYFTALTASTTTESL
jgi:hypothetical protein